MRIFVVDDQLKEQIKKLIDFAEANPFTMDDMLDVFNKAEVPPGDREGYSLVTPFGVKMVYTIEKQLVGDVRHLSVGVNKDHAFPDPEIVKEIMRLFGFKNEIEKCHVHIEKINETRGAINIIELK